MDLLSEPTRLRLVRWSFGALMCAVLLTAAGSVLLGGHDALLSYRSAERLLGVTVAFAGLANLTAMVLTWHGRARLAALGFAVGTLPGLLLAAVRTSFDQNPWAAVWLLGAVAPIDGEHE